LGLGTLLAIGDPAHGLSLNEQIKNQLDTSCDVLFGIDPRNSTTLGPNLLEACRFPTTGSGASAGASGATQTSTFLPSAAIEERLSRARDGEDETGASSTAIDIGGGISLFITGEYEEREKDGTSFQDETDSDNTTLTIGADTSFSEKLVGGVALSVKNEDGDFESGGGFDNDTTGVFFYGSFLPSERFFVDVVVGYSTIDLDIEREPFYEISILPVRPDLTGTASSDDANADELTASLLLGYDYPIGSYTVGPRVGIQFKQTDFDSYSETGDSGLELRYDDHSFISRRIVLGFFASTSISTGSAVLVPQITVDYINESEDDRDSITASFVEDLRDDPGVPGTAKKFKFETDEWESDWLEIGVGLVAVFPHDVQAFANFSAFAMNDLYDSWTASAGVRLAF
jgi:outer membrane autotransporter protein